MTENKQTTDVKTWTVSSREAIYKGAGNDIDLNPYRDAVLWYEGNDMDEALRIARKYAADVRDTGKVEVCKNGISRIATSRTPPSSRKCSKRCAASGGRTGRVMTSSTRLSTSYSPPSANAQLEHFETGAVAWSHPSLRKA